jgi:hypothetical protein
MLARSLAAAVVVAISLAAAPSALAVINTPPVMPHDVTVFPMRDFVSVTEDPNTAIRVDVIRNGVNVGTATGTTGADGLLEVNHPGGVCWMGFTPDIMAGDVVQATEVANPTVGDATRTSEISVENPTLVGGNVVIHGNTPSPLGTPLPIGSLEQRVVEPGLLPFIGKRDVRAPGAGTGWVGSFAYDPIGPANPNGTRFTATYTGLSSQAADLVANGDNRILSWIATNAAGDRLGLTIYESTQVGGPGFGGCPLGASNAVTAPGTLNAKDLAAGAADIAITGAAQPDATAVSLTITDGTNTIDVPAGSVALAGGSWTAAVPAAQLAALKDGQLTVAGSYTVPGGTITGTTLSVVKDTVAPGAPSSSPAPGAYESAQSLTLSSNDGTAEIRYTTDGSEPTPTSNRLTGQLSVTSSRTVKAIAVDPAGNASPVATLDYAIAPKPPLRIEVPGRSQVIVQREPARKALALAGLTAKHSVTRRSLRRSGLLAHVTLADDTDVLRVRLYRQAGKRRQLVTSFFRFPESDGAYRLVMRSKAVRGLKRGRYLLEVTPGVSRRNLGAPSLVGIRVL